MAPRRNHHARTNRRVFADLLGRQPGKVGDVRLEPQRQSYLTNPGRPGLDQYWHPQRMGVEPGPSWFSARLAAISPKLAVCRPPARAPLLFKRRAWLVWCREPAVTHPLCPGWTLLFAWETPWREPLPLDDRILANLYLRDPNRYRDAVQYYDRITAEQTRTEEYNNRAFDAHTMDRSLDVRQYRKIKNIGLGNKFALHHDGSMIPSRGEANWRKETLYQRLPASVRAEVEEQDERLTKGQHSVSDAAGMLGDRSRQWADVLRQLEAPRLRVSVRQLADEIRTERRRSRIGYTGATS
jgi:hypothetical protein